jgi:hypothetical protein
MLRKQKAATNVQARLVCAEVYRDANPVCRCFRRPAEYTAGQGWGQIYFATKSGGSAVNGRFGCAANSCSSFVSLA